MNKLTAKQELFVKEYLIDLNATRAYIRAGYKVRGNVAEAAASRLLRNVKVDIAIQLAKQERAEQLNIDAKGVLSDLLDIKEMDVLDILTDSGDLKPVREWPKVWRTTISGLDIASINGGDTETILKKIKWPDKLKNLELIGKHVEVQAWKDKIEHSGDENSPVTFNFVGVDSSLE